MKPYYEADGVTIYHGDCREIIPGLAPEFDIVLTDPPYSSGGAMRSDRSLPAAAKYRLTNVAQVDPDFSGDNRDQRSFERWCSHWLSDCLQRTRSGGALISFIDWRNLPSMVDAVQIGGWVYRGIAVWDKGGSCRPDQAWFASQAEYMVLASRGPLKRGAGAPGICQRGVFHHTVSKNKQHITEKPVSLLTDLLQTRTDWLSVLDPFAGSGTTLRAAKELGKEAVGIEQEEAYCEIAAKRLDQGVLPLGAA